MKSVLVCSFRIILTKYDEDSLAGRNFVDAGIMQFNIVLGGI